MAHESVLLHEVVEALSLRDGEVVLDATVNGGGHSEALLRQARITLIGLDLDRRALEAATERLQGMPGRKVHLREKNFRNLDEALLELGIASIDKALFDLGLSSNQLELSGRGFSFKRDEPLLMTFSVEGEAAGLTAHSIVNEWAEEDIANVIYGYGEERFARRIAKAIVERREKSPIETSGDLAQIVEDSTPRAKGHRRVHPATKTFQALRIAANDELGNIREGIPKAFERLRTGGRLAVISFHSIEDRIIKILFKTWAAEGKGKLLSKKPIPPTEEERTANPRSRSAKLRVIEKMQ
jgi:16S rRNA (cytosine1402-N4)-methyltransferase